LYVVLNLSISYDYSLHPDPKGRKTLKENQGEKGLYKRGEANPSRGETPQDKSWSSRMGVGHRATTQFQKNKFCYEISVKYSRLDIWKTN